MRDPRVGTLFQVFLLWLLLLLLDDRLAPKRAFYYLSEYIFIWLFQMRIRFELYLTTSVARFQVLISKG